MLSNVKSSTSVDTVLTGSADAAPAPIIPVVAVRAAAIATTPAARAPKSDRSLRVAMRPAYGEALSAVPWSA